MTAFIEMSIEKFLLFLIFINHGSCKLFPIRLDNEDLSTAMFPNERVSLDDCHLRYYKYGQSGIVAPAFGEPAFLREFAHMAAIGWTQPDGSISWKCGGSLIWDDWVLTAAHCTSDNGTAPDVARFGDINLFSDKDDQYAQQLNVVEVFRHPEYTFSSTYNDIALLKLERNVTLHPTVAPACLWTDNEVRFPSLEATGWGDTGFAQERTPSLLKVSLKPMSNDECKQFYSSDERRLRMGIQDHQICAGDERMDTCPGDSGGPLQIKLLHNGKISPFLVGITSFGSACGTSTPGVYTRVSAYYTWITETLERQGTKVLYWMEPVSCAYRQAYLREYEDDVIVSRSEDYISLDISKSHVDFAGKELIHKVEIIGSYSGLYNNCSGTLIADDTVLTLAECTSRYGVAATHIQYNRKWIINDLAKIAIAETHIHPDYREYSLYNNIAVLKLKERVKFVDWLGPACIWPSTNIPSPQVQVSGVGRTDLSVFNRGEAWRVFVPQETNLIARASINTDKNCSIPVEFRSRLPRGLAQEHICVGNRMFIVPGTCSLLYGAPVQQPMYRYDRFFYYAYGLNLFGRDCGFGEASVSTRLSTHLDWLNTILLPNSHDGNASIQFINREWKENETCEYDYDEDIPGVCVQYTRCPKVWNDFKANRRVNFCSSGSVVCCPTKFIQKDRSSAETDALDTCRADYAALHPRVADLEKSTGLPYIATITSTAAASNRCLAALITKRAVVTSASCILSNSPAQAVLADMTSVPIEETIIHPNFRKTDTRDNIALLKLSREILLTAAVFPACVWMNLTHTPLNLRLINEGNTTFSAKKVVPMYNTDCQRDYKRKLNSDQLCIDELNLDVNSTCYRYGDQLVWTGPDDARLDRDTTGTPHVVGFYSYGERCDEANPGVFTRIASYVEWIRQII